MRSQVSSPRVRVRTAGRNSNARVVAAAARGDETAWNTIVDRYSRLVWAIARSHRLSSGDAADVVQATWLRLVEHLADIRNADGIGSWLATTARRESLLTIRRAARCEPSDDIDVVADTPALGIDADLLREERQAAVAAALQRLPTRDQSLLRLLTLDPAPSYEEISAALVMPIGSIGPTRSRALERLRRELRRAGAHDMVRDAD
jgi:RNA polymerase sigma factor (sigma-70 family)